MSEDSRWNVDMRDEATEEVSQFDVGMWWIMTEAEVWEYSGEHEVRDFIIELVAEIERLETEVITLRDVYKKRTVFREKLSGVWPYTERPKPQPFYMEPE